MRFTLIDRILELDPGKSITAVKNLSLAEEYLADHFPGFPVMPGVLMVEAIVQAGAWLLRATTEFEHSIIVLKEARNVKFASFGQPGKQLTVKVRVRDRGDTFTKCQGEVTCEDNGQPVKMVSARVTLAHFKLVDRYPWLDATDRGIVGHLREMYDVLRNHDLSVARRTSPTSAGVRPLT